MNTSPSPVSTATEATSSFHSSCRAVQRCSPGAISEASFTQEGYASAAKWHSPRVPLGRPGLAYGYSHDRRAGGGRSRGETRSRGALKIAVCVKEVPDATAPKRIDAGTKRLDRSGEKTHEPVRCARPRGGGAAEGGGGRRRTAGSRRSAWVPRARCARCTRRSRWVRTRRCSSAILRSRARTSQLRRACSPLARSTSAPTSCCSASRPPTRTPTSWRRPSPSICSCRSSRRSRGSS